MTLLASLTLNLLIVATVKASVPSDFSAEADLPVSNYIRLPRQAQISDSRRCSNTLYRLQCSSSYTQDLMNDISDCGGVANTAVSFIEGTCRQNSNKDYCGSLVVGLNTLSTAFQTCDSSASQSGSCSSTCRSHLNTIAQTAGCCLRTNILLNSFLFHFFNICAMPLPAECSATSLTIPAVTNSSCVMFEDFQRRLVQFQCRRNNIEPILDALRSNGCQDFASAYENTCSFRRNGRYCSEQFPLANSDSIFSSAMSSCNTTSSCSPSCLAAVQSLNSSQGCCINNFNTTRAVDSFGVFTAALRTVTSNQLWTTCGVTPPGRCEIRINGAIALVCSSKMFVLILTFLVLGFFY